MIWDALIPIVSAAPFGVGLAMLALRVHRPGTSARRREPTGRKLRRLQATARRKEARRVRRLPPVEAMLDYKAKRRREETLMWMTRFRELVPAPREWDWEGKNLEKWLFSGDPVLIRRAIAPPPTKEQPNVLYEPKRNNVFSGSDDEGDFVEVRNHEGHIIIRYPNSP